MLNRIVNILLGLAVCAYIFSLVSPAFVTDNSYVELPPSLYTYWGWQVLLFGIFGVLDGTIAWFANPCLVLSLILTVERSRFAVLAATIGLALAVSAILYTSIWGDGDPRARIVEYKIGFYAWILSFVLVEICALASNYSFKRDRREAAAP